MASRRFVGKHCVVVGATGTIGVPIAKAFAEHGAVVTLLSRGALRARAGLEKQLPAAPPRTDSPVQHRFIQLDVLHPDQVKEAFSHRVATDGVSFDASGMVQHVGPMDILVNCAGIPQTSLLKRTPDPELARILNTNLLAAMLVCKYARVRPHGCIVNISSLMATKGGLGATAYAASKAGVVGFTRALCREMAPRSIRVNALLPGWVQSQLWDDLKPELKEAYLKDTPINRVADPAEVADAALFLASNGFANNCILNLDGGLSAA